MKERLIPVKRESQLRAGVLLVLKPCAVCGRAHRGMLIGPATTKACPMRDSCHACWEVRPGADHHGNTGYLFCTHHAIPEGRLFIVDPFAKDDATTGEKAPTRRPAHV